MIFEDKLNKAFDKHLTGLTEKETKFFKFIKEKIIPAATTILKGAVFSWIWFKIYNRIGAEKTIISLLITIAFILIMSLKKGGVNAV